MKNVTISFIFSSTSFQKKSYFPASSQFIVFWKA